MPVSKFAAQPKPPADFLRDFATVASGLGVAHATFHMLGHFDGRTLTQDNEGRWELTGACGASLEAEPETFVVTVVTDQTEDELRDLLARRPGGRDVPLGFEGTVEGREFVAGTGERFQRLAGRLFALGA